MSIPFIPAKPRRHRKPEAITIRTAPILVSAAYDFDGPSVTLTFDQAVNIDDYDGTQITVDDPVNNGHTYVGTVSATLDGPNVVVIVMDELGGATGTTDVLNASATTGITSTSGVAWGGVTDYPV